MRISHQNKPSPLPVPPLEEKLPHLQSMGRRQRRAAETRLRLFRSALQLFAQRGFSNVTVEDITEAADVGKGTFFNYFQSKEHVLGVMAEIQLGKVREAAALADDGQHSIQSAFRHLFHREAEEPGRSPDLARTLISCFLASEEVRHLIEHNMKEGRKLIAGIVAAGQKRGEIDPQLKKETVAIQLLQGFMGTVLFWSLHEQPALDVWIEDSFQHFWRAVALPGREQQP